jgi:rubrerythrin
VVAEIGLEKVCLNIPWTVHCNLKLTNLIIEAAKKSLRVQSIKKVKKKWHNPNVELIKKDIISIGKNIRRYPNDPFLRAKYIAKKNEYHKLVKKINRKQKQEIMDRIANMEDKNPKEFWKLVYKLKDSQNKDEDIDPMTLFQHFQELNNKDSLNKQQFDKSFENKIKRKLESLWNEQKSNPILDKPIDKIELTKNIQHLANNKAGGLDQMSNEMFKYGIDALSKPILKLFNLVLESGVFPKDWCSGLIVPLFKNGCRDDPNNYRGITLSSNLGKLFTKIMSERLYNYLVESEILHDYQIGFKKKHGTADHIFVLKCIIDQAKKKRQKVFVAFVDFQKAFDTIWRDGLFFKLLKTGLSTHLCKLLENMYSKLTSSIKVKNQRTDFFKSELGTRQGCHLSPWLFNMYINELPMLLNDINKDIIILGNKKVPILMYADDIVLISRSASGLQRSLDLIFKYCKKWKLVVNIKKTKVMIFNCRKSSDLNFKYGEHQLKITITWV